MLQPRDGKLLRAFRQGLVADPRSVLGRLCDGGMWLADIVLEAALRTSEQAR